LRFIGFRLHFLARHALPTQSQQKKESSSNRISRSHENERWSKDHQPQATAWSSHQSSVIHSPAAHLRGIILIGMRGVGKTTVGELVAKHFNSSFCDLDALALSFLGASSVRNVFHTQGEHVWRDAESAALHKFFQSDALLQPQGSCTRSPSILAIGGGAPANPSCIPLIQDARKTGWRVVLLTSPIDVLVKRLSKDLGDRAALTKHPLAEELAQLSRERSIFYSTLADAEVDGSSDPAIVCAAIAALTFS
jgi:shikimate kinase